MTCQVKFNQVASPSLSHESYNGYFYFRKKLEEGANLDHQLCVSLLTGCSTPICFVFLQVILCTLPCIQTQKLNKLLFSYRLSKEFPFSFHLTAVPNYLKIRMANLTPATSSWNKSHYQHVESHLHQRHVCSAHLHAAFPKTSYFSLW